MTGSGTIASPYIVSTWDEFLSVCSQTDIHIKFADGGGIIDMNEIYPEGMTETVTVNANVDGNGWSIKNLCVNNITAFYANNKISNLNFVDFSVLCTSSHARLIVFGESNNIYGLIENFTFTGSISGQVDNTAFAAMIAGSSNNAVRITVSRCSFKLKITGGISMNASNKVICSNCIFDVDSSENSAKYPFYDMHFRNCLIKGKYQNLVLSAGYSKYVILDVECPSVDDVFGITKSEFIIGNVDKSSYDTNKFYALTTEQLKDKDYLLSLGLPVGNDKITTINVSNFEQGGFYTYNGTENSATGSIRSNWIPITNTAMTIECGDFRWQFKCQDASGDFKDISAHRLQKNSGETAVLTEYPWIAETKIGLAYLDASAISLPQICTLYNGYPWKINSEQNDGLPFPVFAPKLQFSSTSNGAFKDVVQLTEIYIPESVKKIGSYSFSGTSLTYVKIAPDCTYSDTSFPMDCVVEFYDAELEARITALETSAAEAAE